jgi:hypothetical protein
VAEADIMDDGFRRTKSLVEDDKLDELVDVVNQAFPNLSCLRCSSEQFYLVRSQSVIRQGLVKFPGDDHPKANLDIVELICTRCGHIEKHEITILKKASKPITK